MCFGTTGKIVEIVDDHTACAVIGGRMEDVFTVMPTALRESIAVLPPSAS